MNKTLCSPEDLQALASHPNLHYLKGKENVGLVFVAGTSLISLISVVVFFALLLHNVMRARGRPLIQKPMDIYLLSLFIADLLHGLGGTLIFKWIHDGKLQTGNYCSAQGLLLNVGSVSIAICTFIIAWHTFLCVWWSKKMSSLIVPCITTAITWIYCILYAVINFSVLQDHANPYYAPTPYWCWVGSHYLFHRIAGQWIWMWTALFFSLVLYSLLFFRSRAIFSLINIFHNSSRWSSYISDVRRISLTMLLYASTYCIVVLPACVVRWSEFSQERNRGTSHIPTWAIMASVAIYNLSGLVNVIIFFSTRSDILLFGRGPDEPDDTLTEIHNSFESERVTVADPDKSQEVSIREFRKMSV